jgi:hypothetical protein
MLVMKKKDNSSMLTTIYNNQVENYQIENSDGKKALRLKGCTRDEKDNRLAEPSEETKIEHEDLKKEKPRRNDEKVSYIPFRHLF